jgi:hypothetical protein
MIRIVAAMKFGDLGRRVFYRRYAEELNLN